MLALGRYFRDLFHLSHSGSSVSTAERFGTYLSVLHVDLLQSLFIRHHHDVRLQTRVHLAGDRLRKTTRLDADREIRVRNGRHAVSRRRRNLRESRKRS